MPPSQRRGALRGIASARGEAEPVREGISQRLRTYPLPGWPQPFAPVLAAALPASLELRRAGAERTNR